MVEATDPAVPAPAFGARGRRKPKRVAYDIGTGPARPVKLGEDLLGYED